MEDEFIDKAIRAWKYWLPIVLYLLFKDNFGYVTMYQSTQWLLWYFAFLFMSETFIDKAKNLTSQVVGNDVHFSIKHPSFVGEWAIFSDYVDALGASFNLRKQTLIVKADHTYKVGSNYVTTCHVHKVRFEQLPYDIQKEVHTRNFNKKNVYFGFVSQNFEKRLTQEPDVEETFTWLKEQWEMANQSSTRNREAAKANFKDLEGMKGAFDRLTRQNKSVAATLLHRDKERSKEE